MRAMSIFFIVIIASKARFASAPPVASASVSARAVIFVLPGHRGSRFRVWLYTLLDFDHGIAGFLDRVPPLCTDSCKQCATIGCAFFGSEDFDVVTVSVCLNLAPEVRAGASSSE